MKNVLTVLIVLVTLALVGGFVLAQSGNDLFQQALVKERAGSYQEAIKLYQTIVQKNSSDRKLAAKALFQMGQAYEKLGNTEARKTYERIAQEFGDQKDVAADATRRLALLNDSPISGKSATRVVMSGNSVDLSASVSLDGRWMAMTDWSAPNVDLVIRDMSTGLLKSLLSGSCGPTGTDCVYADTPIFSPDAQQVAYAWYDDLKTRPHNQLRVIANAAGAKPHVLVSGSDFGIWPTAWSSDGKSILVRIQRPDRTWQLAWVTLADSSVKVLKSLEWRLKGGPSLSPDGRYIAYSALVMNPRKAPPPLESTEQHIYVLAADGSSESDLVTTAAVNDVPVWTPDSSHVVFTSDITGESDLWSVAVRNGRVSGTPSRLKRDVGQIQPEGMTRSGSYYYVQSNVGVEQVSIAELARDGGSRIVESFVGMNPAWSPDGKSVAFTRHSSRGGNREDKYELVIRSVETGAEKLFVHEGVRPSPPRWFHEGKVLLVLVQTGNTVSWCSVDLNSGEFKDVISRDSFRTGLALSPDDRTLYLGSRDPKATTNIWDRIVAVDIVSGQERQIAVLQGTVENGALEIVLSPDGRTLAIQTTNPKTKEARVARISVDGANYRELYAFPFRPLSISGRLAWTKDSRAILFTTADDDGRRSLAPNNFQILQIAIAGGKPEFTGLAVKDLSSFDVSPDGSHVAFSTNTIAPSAHELMAIDNLPALLKDSQ